jgi:hypothetical protein
LTTQELADLVKVYNSGCDAFRNKLKPEVRGLIKDQDQFLKGGADLNDLRQVIVEEDLRSKLG